uniref:Protein MRVI1 n=1 Tax=Lygus hesperus TaxID=30085 RepID=A0A0A9Y753_LYGHE
MFVPQITPASELLARLYYSQLDLADKTVYDRLYAPCRMSTASLTGVAAAHDNASSPHHTTFLWESNTLSNGGNLQSKGSNNVTLCTPSENITRRYKTSKIFYEKSDNDDQEVDRSPTNRLHAPHRRGYNKSRSHQWYPT